MGTVSDTPPDGCPEIRGSKHLLYKNEEQMRNWNKKQHLRFVPEGKSWRETEGCPLLYKHEERMRNWNRKGKEYDNFRKYSGYKGTGEGVEEAGTFRWLGSDHGVFA